MPTQHSQVFSLCKLSMRLRLCEPVQLDRLKALLCQAPSSHGKAAPLPPRHLPACLLAFSPGTAIIQKNNSEPTGQCLASQISVYYTPVEKLLCMCLQLPGAYAIWLPDGIDSVERLPDLPASWPCAEHHILTPGLHPVQRLYCV